MPFASVRDQCLSSMFFKRLPRTAPSVCGKEQLRFVKEENDCLEALLVSALANLVERVHVRQQSRVVRRQRGIQMPIEPVRHRRPEAIVVKPV